MAQPRATKFGSCEFSCEDFVTVALKMYSHVARRSSSRASATSYTLLSYFDVLGLPGHGSLSMLTNHHEHDYPNEKLYYGPL